MCDGSFHNLIKIVEYDVTTMDSKVVRWCMDCGAVVVDRDYDGRTNPAAIVKMKFPLYKFDKK